MAEDAVLGVGVDPTSAETGSRRATRALGDIRKAARELDAALGITQEESDKTGKAAGDMQRAFNDLRRTVLQLAAAFGVFKLAGAIKESALLSARVETLGVVMERVAANVGITADEAHAYAEGVRRMGITTQEARSSVVNMIQAQIDLKDASKLARLAQDAAVIGNTNSSDAFARLVFGIKAAQVEVLRTIGINVTFERGYQKLARELGVNQDALTESQKAQARLNEVMSVGVFITGAYEASMQTAAKILGSTARLIEEAQRKIGDVLLDTFKTSVLSFFIALEDLNRALDELKDAGDLSDLRRQIGETFENLALSIARALDFVAPFFGAIMTGFDQIVTTWNQLPDVLKDLGLLGALFLGAKGVAGVTIVLGVLDQLSLATDKLLAKAGAPQGLRDFFADPAGLGKIGSPRTASTIMEDEGSIVSPLLADLPDLDTFEGKVRNLFNRAEEFQKRALKDAPLGRPPLETRQDINITQLEKANRLLLEQAGANERLAQATLISDDATRKVNLSNKERLFIFQKLNENLKGGVNVNGEENTEEAARIAKLVDANRTANEALDASTRSVAAAQAVRKAAVSAEGAQRLAVASERGAIAVKREEQAILAHNVAIKAGAKDTDAFIETYDALLFALQTEATSKSTKDWNLWAETQREAAKAADRLAEAQRAGRDAVRAFRIDEEARSILRKRDFDPDRPGNAALLEATRREIAARDRSQGGAAHAERIRQLEAELRLQTEIQKHQFDAGPQQAFEITLLREKTRLRLEDNKLAENQIDKQARLAATIAQVGAAAAERFRTITDFTSAISSGFEQAIIDGRNLIEVLGNLGREIQRIILRRVALQPLERGIGRVLDSFLPFQHGGRVTGPGGPRSDNILARVSPGEFIVNAESASRFGPLLDAINKTPRFVSGGSVAPLPLPIVPARAAGSNVTINSTTNVTVEATGGDINPDQAAKIGNAVKGQVKAAFNELLREQMRPGNILNPQI